MTSITIKTGSEGPKHDPYHYEQITVRRSSGDEIVYHCGGLSEWLEVRANDRVIRAAGYDETEECRRLFEAYVGVSYEVAVKAYRSLPWRRLKAHPCGLQFICDVPGYPGETLTVCGKCGHVIDGHMDMSAII